MCNIGGEEESGGDWPGALRIYVGEDPNGRNSNLFNDI